MRNSLGLRENWTNESLMIFQFIIKLHYFWKNVFFSKKDFLRKEGNF